MLGHSVEDRSAIAAAQDMGMAARLQALTSTPLRHARQRGLFMVAPLDVLVTRDEATQRNKFHIIEINGTGIAGRVGFYGEITTTVIIILIIESFSLLQSIPPTTANLQ